jgi:prefoldin subunit 5
MAEQNSRDWVEVLVAIGRIEEGIKSVRDSIDRLDKKSDAQDEAISEMQLDIQKLKTQRSTVRENIAMIVSVIAVLVAALSVALP